MTATDPDMNHVNGTHIDFVQKGENPRNREPMFVVYTDQGRLTTSIFDCLKTIISLIILISCAVVQIGNLFVLRMKIILICTVIMYLS